MQRVTLQGQLVRKLKHNNSYWCRCATQRNQSAAQNQAIHNDNVPGLELGNTKYRKGQLFTLTLLGVHAN